MVGLQTPKGGPEEPLAVLADQFDSEGNIPPYVAPSRVGRGRRGNSANERLYVGVTSFDASDAEA